MGWDVKTAMTDGSNDHEEAWGFIQIGPFAYIQQNKTNEKADPKEFGDQHREWVWKWNRMPRQQCCMIGHERWEDG